MERGMTVGTDRVYCGLGGGHVFLGIVVSVRTVSDPDCHWELADMTDLNNLIMAMEMSRVWVSLHDMYM